MVETTRASIEFRSFLFDPFPASGFARETPMLPDCRFRDDDHGPRATAAEQAGCLAYGWNPVPVSEKTVPSPLPLPPSVVIP